MTADPSAPTATPFAADELLRHRRFLRGLAGALVRGDEAAEDLVQDCLLAAVAEPPSSERALRAWLARVARNLASNVHRAERRRSERELASARADRAAAADAVAERLDLQRRVVSAVRALPAPCREAIYLRWYEDLAPTQIARRTGVPLETVRSRLRRGLARLRAELDDEYGERGAWALLLVPMARRPARPAGVAPLAGALGLVAAGAAVILASGLLPFSSAGPSSGLEPPLARASAARLDRFGDALTRRPAANDVALATSEVELAPSTLRVVDARTLEPVPELELRIASAEGEPLALGTDAAGLVACTLAGAFEPGSLTLHDGPAALPVAFTLRDSPEPGELLVLAEPGPTFAFELAPRPDLPLAARLLWQDDAGELAATPWIPLRDGPHPWVRFPALPAIGLASSGGRAAWSLELASADGLLAASTRVHALPGVRAQPVALELEERAAIAGRALDSSGEPVADAPLELRRAGDARARRTLTDREGRFRCVGLPPDDWTLALASLIHEPCERTLALEPGVALELELRAARLACAPVAGTLDSVTGAHVPVGRVRAVSVEDPARVFFAASRPELVEGRRLHSFRFDALPLGEYDVHPPGGDGFPWDALHRRARAGSSELRFLCRDDEPSAPLVVRARDAASGLALERVRLALLPDPRGLGAREALREHGPLELREVQGGELALARLPHRAPLFWLVEREGYRSVQGDARELRREEGALVLDVALEASWRTSLWIGATDERGRARPLAGVRLETAAGRLLATSLADGRIELELAYDPGRLELRLDGWRLRDWEGYRRGRPLEQLDLHRAWMERVAAR